MAKLSTFLSLLALSLLLSTTNSAALITDQELDRTISALRSSGYNLFGNAIATSDLRYQILSAAAYNSFTIFSPLDSALFSLDMASQATAYIQTLHYHVSPRRFTAADLRNLSYVPTLLPHYSLLLNTDPLNVTVFVDGVRISRPNLFFGPGIAVHGLDGILVPGELGLDSPPGAFLSPSVSRELDSNSPSAAISQPPEFPYPQFESNWIAPTVSPPTGLPSTHILPPPPELPSAQILSPSELPSAQISPTSNFPSAQMLSPPELLSSQISPPPPEFLSPQLQPHSIFTPSSAQPGKNIESSRIKNRRKPGKIGRTHRRPRAVRHGHHQHGGLPKVHSHFPDL